MKNKFIIIITLISLMFSSSCSDYLTLEPVDGVVVSKFWKTKEEVHDAVMGCYASMMKSNVMLDFVYWGELRADLVKPRTSTSSYSKLSLFQNGDISSTTSYCDWGDIYTVINNCNTVLHFAKETQKIDDSFTDQLLSEYEAEAKCIRAMMYFYLVRTYKDVPFVTEASLSDAQNYQVAKTDGNQILDSLIVDLKKVDRTQIGGAKGIPYTYGTSVKENKGRFTVWSMKSLLADIYLWKEDYANAISQCNQILASGQFTLVPVQHTVSGVTDIYGNSSNVYYPSEGDANNMFLNMYVNGNSVESILELQFSTDYENPFYDLYNPTNGTLIANTDVLSSNGIFPTSGLDKGWYDIRGDGVDFKQGYVWKWIGLSRTTYSYRANGMSFSNWIFYRLADIKLMKAEALCQVGKQNSDTTKLQESLALVNEVRLRACATETTNEIPDVNNINADVLEKFILTEREREFAHEGKRWFDVLRNAKRNNYAGINYLLDLASTAASPDKVLSLQNKWKGDHNSHYLPILESELRTNKALTQNPFYK